MRSRNIAVVALVFVLVCAVPAFSQDRSQLVGAWERVALTNADGVASAQPQAFIMFSADGHYGQIVLPPGRPKSDLSIDEMTREELLARYRGTNVRFGTWVVAGNVLTRKDTAALDPRLEGRELVQQFRVEGDVLILTPTTGSGSGMAQEVRFRRMK